MARTLCDHLFAIPIPAEEMVRHAGVRRIQVDDRAKVNCAKSHIAGWFTDEFQRGESKRGQGMEAMRELLYGNAVVAIMGKTDTSASRLVFIFYFLATFL